MTTYQTRPNQTRKGTVMKFQDKSQLGLHFEPDNLGPGNYPMTSVLWNRYRDSFQYKSTMNNTDQSASVQLVIEAGYHTLQELEHNSPDTGQGSDELEIAALVIEDMISMVLERYQER